MRPLSHLCIPEGTVLVLPQVAASLQLRTLTSVFSQTPFLEGESRTTLPLGLSRSPGSQDLASNCETGGKNLVCRTLLSTEREYGLKWGGGYNYVRGN